METQLPPTLHKLASVSARTGLSRSALYREIFHSEKNPTGRLKVVRIGRSVRVREQDLADFINALAS
jgi:predicted DNA-binding transcriptional regulator AlpA